MCSDHGRVGPRALSRPVGVEASKAREVARAEAGGCAPSILAAVQRERAAHGLGSQTGDQKRHLRARRLTGLVAYRRGARRGLPGRVRAGARRLPVDGRLVVDVVLHEPGHAGCAAAGGRLQREPHPRAQRAHPARRRAARDQGLRGSDAAVGSGPDSPRVLRDPGPPGRTRVRTVGPSRPDLESG